MSVKRLIAVLALAALVVTAVLLCAGVVGRVPEVQREMRATPTPTPVYGNVMAVTPDPAAPTAAPLLKSGSTGDLVTQLQARLTALGYYHGVMDGQYGPGTKEAVARFQQVNGLDDDGVAGPDTSAALYAPGALPCPTESPATEEPTARPASVDSKPYVRADGLPMLVNAEFPLPDGYAPHELVELNAYCDKTVVKIKYDDTWAEREAVDALQVMLRAAIDEGIGNWQISAAYRDVAYQQKLMNNKVNEYLKEGFSRTRAESAARKTVAEPGTSEHHLGTAFDITVPGVSFAGTKQAEWLAENCWDYGFIQRYTKEKESITGFVAEAWHFRYVGVEHSVIMRDENLCLEEYIDRYGLEIDEE